MISKPNEVELTTYFKSYINLVEENELIEALENQLQMIIDLFSSIQFEQENYQYEIGKWTIKELLQHIIDSERIFNYRALRFSRKDHTELAGYDDNDFINNSNCKNRTLDDLIQEFKIVRQSTIYLFQSMNSNSIDFKGKANRNEITSRIIGWMIAGHSTHHCQILKERYL
jgi:hypothetical protein